jgi:hypothetical protein
LAVACVWLSGCHGGSGANVVTVTLTDSLGGRVVVTQADTITATVAGPATVAGATNLNVTFMPCQYSTTPPAGSTMKAVTLAACPTDGSFGTFSNVQPTTEIYTAPAKIPDPTKFPNLVLTITAVSVADTSKKGTLTLTLDSGITVTISPTAATLAVGQGGNPGESRLFTASLTSDTTQGGVMWGVTNTTVNTGGTPSIANTFTLTTPQCSPSCGSIAASPGGNETFTAPSALPTNTTAILYAIAVDDPSRFATTTISLVAGGNIVFNNLWPTVVPQGGSQADIFLNATNLTSQIGLTLTNNTTGLATAINAGSDALKVFFRPSTFGATTGPVSTGARLRLTPDQLAKPATYTVAITPGNPADQTTPIPTFSFKVVPVRPGLVASNPSDIAQGSGSVSTPVSISVDGGYYGAQDNLAVSLNFNGGALVAPVQPAGSDPRRLIGQVTTAVTVPGLLPINVTNSLDTSNISTVYSNIAVLPSYANESNQDPTTAPLPFDINNKVFVPCVAANQPPPAPGTQPTCAADVNGNFPFLVCTTPGSTTCPIPATISLGANTMPSAIAVDPILGYAAITEAGTNTVQFLNLSATPLSPSALSAQFPTGVPAAGNLPTGVAIDRHVCAKGTAADPTTGQCPVGGPFQAIAAVVNYEAQTLAVLTIPNGTLIETIPLNNLIPPSGLTGAGANTSPFPYSVGIDPFTHRALVAFASTNAGFVINLDPSQSPNICLPGFAPPDGTSYCPVALATLNTGSNPQIAFESGAHLAYATPGGAGQLTAVNLSDPSAAPVKIQSATRQAGIVTVTLAPNTSLNFSPTATPTVLISGLPLGAGDPTANPPIAPTSFNGAFPVLSVTSNTTFTYAQTGPNDTATSTAAQQGFLSVGTSDITYAISPTITGIDINPITHSAALADPNNAGASNGGSQVTFIDSLDQSVSSLGLCNEQNLAIVTPTPPCTPELGISAVAYQPFTNTVVSLRFDKQNLFNNQISLLNPAAFNRVTIVETGQMTATSICFPTTACSSNPQGTGAVTVNLNGALAVDPIHNLALAVNSGSGTITPLFLGNIKPLQIETVSTPPVDASSKIPNPANLAQSVIINSTALPQSVSGVQIFGRGFDSTSVVRLDGVPLPPSDVTFSSSKPNELDLTISAANGAQNILTAPHNFGLDVANSDGTTSNVMDFHVIEAVPLPACTAGAAAPGGVAIADDLVFTGKNYAVVTETGCAQVAVINLNAGSQFATFTTIGTGNGPTGVATIPRFGYAVVSNNTDGTASILDLTTGARVAGATTDVVVGTSPSGVAIEQETGLAIVANTGSNTATVIDMTPLQANPVGTLAPLTVATDQEPIAVAIDPDRGANATGEAIVTSLNISASPASGALDVVDLSTTVPAKNATATIQVGSIPTGIIFDPASFPARLFYATESDSNAFITYNPDTGATSTVQVGINPFAVAYNFQTSSILTVNSTSNTSSIIDSLSFRTQNTLGIGGASLFSAAIEPFSNLAVIADQANNRVLLFPMPH